MFGLVNVDGLHPLSVANKKHVVVAANNVHLDFIASTKSANSMEETSSDSHLLVLSLHMQSILFLSRSLDEDFVKYVAECYENMASSKSSFLITHSLPVKRNTTLPQTETTLSGSLGSQVVKISDISIFLHYRFISPIFENSATPLKLLPIEIGIGLLSLSSKSSVMENMRVMRCSGVFDSLPGQNEKFNITLENVNCAMNSEMLLYALQALMAQLQPIKEISLKLRMLSTCNKYQNAIALYALLQKVRVHSLLHPSCRL